MPKADAEMTSALRDLLESRPDLADGLRAARSLEDAAEILARIAAVNGLPMSAAELRHHFTTVMAAPEGPIADEALDAVAAGAMCDSRLILALLRWPGGC